MTEPKYKNMIPCFSRQYNLIRDRLILNTSRRLRNSNNFFSGPPSSAALSLSNKNQRNRYNDLYNDDEDISLRNYSNIYENANSVFLRSNSSSSNVQPCTSASAATGKRRPTSSANLYSRIHSKTSDQLNLDEILRLNDEDELNENEIFMNQSNNICT